MRRLRTTLALVAVCASALLLATGAGADNVGVSPQTLTLNPGGSSSVSYSVHATGSDGCNAATTPVDVTLTPQGPISLSANTLTFTACDSGQSVTVSVAADGAPGTYAVTAAVSAPDYNTSPADLTVTVEAPADTDTQDPVLSLPPDITAEATSASGAVVTFSVSATDNADTSVAISCTQPSGSTFPITTTAVTCTATDDAGNSTQGTFSVTVRDTTAPAISVPPSPLTAAATSLAGATVTFSASATDIVDGAVTVTCSPESGSTFAVGSTTVTCSATDSHANSDSKAFTVTVTNAGPTLVLPPKQTAEADGPTGATVTFNPAPSASDAIDGPLPVTCNPSSGARFPRGTTLVTCTATDSSGASVSGSFEVAVVDTTPPVVTAPPDATFVSESGPLPRSNPSLAAYLARGQATDLVDGAPTLVIEAPDAFPYGETIVRFVAVDSAGNTASASTKITIIPPPPPGQPRPTPPAVDPPPGNVSRVRAVPGNRSVRVSWTAPRDSDIARYVVSRSERTGTPTEVFNGAATSFTDRGLVNGVEYRYVIVAYDRAGHRSVGVAVLATPYLPMLLAPRDGARVARGATFTWRRVGGARYYNFQLFRVVGTQLQKVLSVWPVGNRFVLRASWKFGGRRYRLVPGTYRWYVWPGLGSRADARYGTLLGERSFVVTRRRR